MPTRKAIFLSIRDTGSKNHWSGLNFYILQALQVAADKVDVISGFQPKHTTWLKIRYRISRLFGNNFYYDLTTAYGRQYAKQVIASLTDDRDAVLFTMNSQLLPFLKVPNKIVLYNDATFANLYGYYIYFSNLNAFEKKQAFANEKRAFERADILLFASDWAAQSANRDFGISTEKIHVIPFGANLIETPDRKTITELIEQRNLETIQLLFVGVDFERKGGVMAVEVARQLNEAGLPAKLTIAGVADFENRKLPPFVVNVGVIDKQMPDGEKKLMELYRAANFFIMPSQQECYGVVYAEAAAFGLPILAVDTGGVSTIVQTGYNGWLFQPKDPAARYVQAIREMKNNLADYRDACYNARQAFEDKLNWQVVAEQFRSLIWPGSE